MLFPDLKDLVGLYCDRFVYTSMELKFECECGAEVASYTRGNKKVQLQYRCDECGTIYAVTITPIEGQYA